MIQIISLRKIDKKTIDGFTEPKVVLDSHEELFTNLLTTLEKIPAHERYNLFYTAHQCTDAKREFSRMVILYFDIDAIDRTRPMDYFTPVCNALQVNEEEITIVQTGNGLHFIIHLAKEQHQTSSAYFKRASRHYKAICDKIDAALLDANLPGHADKGIFDRARILRLPGTENVKEGKDPQRSKLLCAGNKKYQLSLSTLSGLPEVDDDQAISIRELNALYPKLDGQAILDGCSFFKWMADSPEEVHEPQLYAGLSITGRLGELGESFTTTVIKNARNSPTIQTWDYSKKKDQAIEASGPRTCASIQGIWGGCSKCPHYQRIRSPVAIKSPDHIATEDTGFHTVRVARTGNIQSIPCYTDLLKAFQKEYRYITLMGTKIIYLYKDTHYKEAPIHLAKVFAQEKFNPSCDNKMASEFEGLVSRTNNRDTEWFNESTTDLVNFSNGVLDKKSGEMLGHSADYGFRYVLPFDHEPGARAYKWERFLKDIFPDDPSARTLLEEFIGYALSNDPIWDAKFLLMLGVGANGKSTLINLIKALAGDGNYAVQTLSLLNTPTGVQSIDGKLFNISAELPSKNMGDTSFFKAITSGDEVMGRKLYQDGYSFVPRAKLIFAANSLPETSDTSEGFYRRFLILPFTARFTDKTADPFIIDKLKEELPGIYNRCTKAYAIMKERRAWTKSLSSEEALRKYKEEGDFHSLWITENLRLDYELDYQRALPADRIYEYYAADAHTAGEIPFTRDRVMKRLKQLLGERIQHTRKDKGRRYLLKLESTPQSTHDF